MALYFNSQPRLPHPLKIPASLPGNFIHINIDCVRITTGCYSVIMRRKNSYSVSSKNFFEPSLHSIDLCFSIRFLSINNQLLNI